MKYIFKKVIPLLLIIVAATPMARGQKFHNQFAMNMLKDYSSYIYVSRLYGDSLTGIVMCNPELGSRDVDLYASCYIESVVDNDGNTYNNEFSSSYRRSPDGLWQPIGKGFFTSYSMNSIQGVIIPTTVKSVKSVKIISNRTLAYDCNNCNYNQSVYTVKNDLKIRWTEIGYKTANHPAEYYFSNKRGVDEIVEGTPVNRYRGRTIIKEKERPLLIHLLGAVGNNATGEVCFIFSVFGNDENEQFAINQLTAFDEDGQSYQYENWNSPSYYQIGRKYGYIEFAFKPFRIPVGTGVLQKVKVEYQGNEYKFEWLNVPIQWVSPK